MYDEATGYKGSHIGQAFFYRRHAWPNFLYEVGLVEDHSSGAIQCYLKRRPGECLFSRLVGIGQFQQSHPYLVLICRATGNFYHNSKQDNLLP